MPRAKRITFSAKLSDKLHLEITGNYSPPYLGSWEDPPEPAEFEYDGIEFLMGDVVMLLDHIDNHLDNKMTISEWMQELCEENYIYE